MGRGPGTLYRKLLSLGYLVTRDRRAAWRFLTVPGEVRRRLGILRRFLTVTNHVRGYHTLGEMLEIADAILWRGRQRPPTVVECGVAHGASTAKLSVAVASVGGRLIACDSFRGLPANTEVHRHLDGRTIVFRTGAFRGRENAVRAVLERWGEPVVELQRGWFADTLPRLGLDDLDVVVLDVDLEASLRTCLVELYPRLAADGVLFCHDGHLEANVALLGDASFWRLEVGVEPPAIADLGRNRLLRIPALRAAEAPPA